MIAVGGFQGNAAVSNAAAEVAEPALAPAAHAEVPEQAWGTGAEWCWQVLKDVEGTEPNKVRRRHGADQSANATGYTFTTMEIALCKKLLLHLR